MRTHLFHLIGAAGFAALIATTLPAFAKDPIPPIDRRGTEGVGGGGGIENKGEYKTFYGAGFYVEPTNGDLPEEVPGLAKLLAFIESRDVLSETIRAELMSKLVPSSTRRYIPLSKKLDPQTEAKLLAAYAQVTKAPTKKLNVYAVTPENSADTYLLPKFYKLTAGPDKNGRKRENSQPAILMHELRWLYPGDHTYENVIASEMAAEAYMDNPGDPAREIEFIKYFGTTEDLMRAYIVQDLKNHALDGLITKDQEIVLKSLLGDSFFNCDPGVNGSDSASCPKNTIAPNLYTLTLRYPKSQFLKFFLMKVENLVFAESPLRHRRFYFDPPYGYRQVDGDTVRPHISLTNLTAGTTLIFGKMSPPDFTGAFLMKCTLNLHPVILTGIEGDRTQKERREKHAGLQIRCNGNLTPENPLHITFGPNVDFKIGPDPKIERTR